MESEIVKEFKDKTVMASMCIELDGVLVVCLNRDGSTDTKFGAVNNGQIDAGSVNLQHIGAK